MANKNMELRYLGIKLLLAKLKGLENKVGKETAPIVFIAMHSRDILDSVKNGPVLVEDPLWLRYTYQMLCIKGAKQEILKKFEDAHGMFYVPFWPDRPRLYKFKTNLGNSWHTF